MGLSYHQEHQLRRVEAGVCRSDPHLAAMFGLFGTLYADDGKPAWEQVAHQSASRSRLRQAAAWIVATLIAMTPRSAACSATLPPWPSPDGCPRTSPDGQTRTYQPGPGSRRLARCWRARSGSSASGDDLSSCRDRSSQREPDRFDRIERLCDVSEQGLWVVVRRLHRDPREGPQRGQWQSPRCAAIPTWAIFVPNSGYKRSKNPSGRPDLNRRPVDPQECIHEAVASINVRLRRSSSA
jgi:hypothetical protein